MHIMIVITIERTGFMKDIIRTAAVFTVFLALIPCLAFLKKGEVKAQSENKVGVYFTAEDKVEEYTEEDYVIGAVLAQMPADFEEEALKAQAVLARTYIHRRRLNEESTPTKELHGALISDDDALYQGFFTVEQAKDFYGDEFGEAYERVRKAVQDAPGILTYEDLPIIAAYHAASSGYTESAMTAWGQDIPYLQAVESKLENGTDCVTTTTDISLQDLADKLSKDYKPDTGTPVEDCIETQSNERGYVTKVIFCGEEIPVSDFTEAAGIPSSCFEFTVQENVLHFISKGYGHLVGMSQYGANLMAKNDMKYEDILNFYFKGCDLTQG